MPILLDLEQDGVEARAACLGSGADDFWLSEIGPSDLLQLRLHRTIQQRLGQRPALLQVDDSILTRHQDGASGDESWFDGP